MRLPILLVVIVAVAGRFAMVWADWRIVAVTPSPEVPAGATVLVAGVPDLELVESPNGVCLRRLNAVTERCRQGVEAAVLSPEAVLARLPYLPMLDQQSQPAPEVQH